MDQLLGKGYLLCAFALAGTSVAAGSFLTRKLPGFTVTAVSMAIVLVCLLPFYAKKALQAIRCMGRTEWIYLALQAIFGIFLFRVFLLSGVRHTSASEAGLLTGTTPAVTAALAYFVLRERLTWPAAAGVAATAAGIILLQSGDLSAIRFSDRHIVGNALVLCAAASESVFNILSRRQSARAQGSPAQLHPMVRTLFLSAAALCLSLVPAMFERPLPALHAIGLQEWLALLWYGVVVTALAFACFFAGAQRCGAYTIAAFSGMMPLTGVFLSILLFREAMSLSQWIGGLLILAGMTLIGRKKKTNAVHAMPPEGFAG